MRSYGKAAMSDIDETVLQLDLNDPYVVMHIVGDVNDHLLEMGRDDDAADFVLQAKGLKHTSEDWSLDDLLAIACQYVDIEDVSDSRLDGAYDAKPMIEDDDDDPEWSDDFQVVNQAIKESTHSVPLDITQPEFPDLWMEWDLDANISQNMIEVVKVLAASGDERALRNFVQDWRGLHHSTWTYKAMFQLAWSYITIYPIPYQYGDTDW